ncbi:MAG: GFA family protein [Deltaproteobacteria bacterium]|nr:GFA family protein [Deltaproteobacteria bacterium]
MKLPLDGGCRCDEVRFRVTEAPLITSACHCNGCQRMSSSAFSLTAICEAASFTVTRGEPVIGGLHDPEQQHFFCPRCMTWMFTRIPAYPGIVNVRATLFDDHAWFTPFMETFTKTKLPWVRTEAVRSFEEFPPPEAFESLMREYAARNAFHLDDTRR